MKTNQELALECAQELGSRIPTLYPRNFHGEEERIAVETINANLAEIIVKYLYAKDAGA